MDLNISVEQVRGLLWLSGIYNQYFLTHIDKIPNNLTEEQIAKEREKIMSKVMEILDSSNIDESSINHAIILARFKLNEILPDLTKIWKEYIKDIFFKFYQLYYHSWQVENQDFQSGTINYFSEILKGWCMIQKSADELLEFSVDFLSNLSWRNLDLHNPHDPSDEVIEFFVKKVEEKLGVKL